jgi:hypothetical protein
MRRFEQFQALPPDERERVMRNYQCWRDMTPEQREQARQRFRRQRR